MPTVADVEGTSGVSTACAQCAHPWDEHVMHARQYPFPTDGWITCPVAECACFGTWSVDDASRPDLQRRRAEHVAQGGTVDLREPDT